MGSASVLKVDAACRGDFTQRSKEFGEDLFKREGVLVKKGFFVFDRTDCKKVVQVGLEGLLCALEFEEERTLPRVDLCDVEFVEEVVLLVKSEQKIGLHLTNEAPCFGAMVGPCRNR